MKKNLVLAFIILLFSCHEKKEKVTFQLPNKQDINSVTNAVIHQGHLPVVEKRDSAKYVYPLSINLRKVKVIVPDTTSLIPRVVDNQEVSIYKLLKRKVKREVFFSNSDTEYLLFQNTVFKEYTIPKDIAANLQTTTSEEQQKRAFAKDYQDYYDLTVPIFSSDGRRAYVEITFNCAGLCGGASAVYLEKINDEWKIIDEVRLWVS